MKTPNVIPVMVVTGIVILTMCWTLITLFTTPERAIASGVGLGISASVFIWVSRTERIAIARANICEGATVLAAMQALTNDSLVSMFASERPTEDQFLEWDRLIEQNMIVTGFGGLAFVICLIIGLVMHRASKG